MKEQFEHRGKRKDQLENSAKEIVLMVDIAVIAIFIYVIIKIFS